MKKLASCLFLLVAGLSGVFLSAQEWEPVAVLVSDVSADESELVVDFIRPVVVDRLVLLESRDGSTKETYSVKHVYGRHVLLKEKLKHAYLAGAKILPVRGF